MYQIILMTLLSLCCIRGYGEELPYQFQYSKNETIVTDPQGGINTVTFDRIQGHKVMISSAEDSSDHASSAVTYYAYDARGRPSRVIEPNGAVHETEYDANALLLRQKEYVGTPLERETRYLWTERRLPERISHSNGLSIDFTYDENGSPLRVIQSDGQEERAWRYTYNPMGQVLTMQAPYNDEDHLVRFTYDTNENLQSITDELGHTTTFNAYDAVGNLLSLTDPNGVITTFTYDPTNLLSSETIHGARTVYGYDKNGHLAAIKHPSGNMMPWTGKVERYGYNYWGDLRYVGSTIGELYQGFDGMGNVTSRIIEEFDDPHNYSFAPAKNNITISTKEVYEEFFTYNSLNQLSEKQDGNGHITRYEYDLSGNVIKIINAKGQETHHHYDVQDHIDRTDNPLQAISKRTYDPFGNLLSISDWNGYTTRYQYNAFHEWIGIESPDQGKTSLSYSKGGQLSSITDAKGTTLSYQYDVLNRLTSIHDHSQPLIQYMYDQGAYGVGRISTITNTDSEIRYTYDAWGQVIDETLRVESQDWKVGYAYDKDGYITSTIYPSGLKVEYAWNQSGKVKTIQAEKQGQSFAIASDILHHPFGPVYTLILGNGTQIDREYDKTYHLVHQRVSGVSDDHYLYDPLGNTTAFVSQDPEQTKHYTYDAMQRLTEMKSGLEVETFHYDANGNRLESTSTQEGQSTYQYDPTRNRLLSYQDDNLHAVTSDANGNITSMGDLSFTYDVFNNLTTVSKAGKMLAHYIYNALNQRVLKQVDDQKTIFIYDQAGKLIEIRGPDSIIDIIYLDDEPIAEVIDGEVYYFVNDRLGTPQYLLGQNGRADWSANILPFRVAAQGSVMQDLRFPGQVEDKESHLVYNNAREYVPHLGRYLQPDPLGLGGGSLNPYTYADNNPVNVTDPTGKNFVIQGLIMGARLAGSAIARVTPASVTNTARAALNTARTAINNYSRKTLPEQVAKITQADKEGQVCSWAERDFTGLRGGSGYELKNAPYQTTRNDPATINGRDYSGHALDQMQNRGVMPSAIENTITTGKIFPTQSGTTGYYDSTNNIRVIVNSETGKVVTTIRGTP